MPKGPRPTNRTKRESDPSASDAADPPPSSRHASTIVRIRSVLPSLPPAEQRVAHKVVEDPAQAAVTTITELAKACGTSETTVIRFCRTVGLSGYPELRLRLATEAARAEGDDRRVVSGDIDPGDALHDVVEKIAFADARAVEETASQLDIDVLERVIDAVVAASRVDIYGVGASAFVALDMQQKLHRVGRVAFAWSDTHVALTSAALLTSDAVAIGISHTGVTRDTIDALAEAHERGATTVALTNFPRSPITAVADMVLTTAARETTFRSGATASRLAQLTVVDCVFVGVAQRTFDDTLSALALTRDAVSSRREGPERALSDPDRLSRQ